MADKSFGVKELNLISASGTPTITSPNSVNINATNVAISTDITVGGMVSLGAGTSISSPGTNVLTFGTNSTEKVRITAAGNVGIASATPATRLDVYKDFSGIGAGTYAGRVYGTDSGVSETGVRFVTKGTGDLHNVSDAYLMHGISNGTTRFVFGANGDIGIANASPTNWGGGVPTIEIKGTASTGSNSTRSGAIAFESGSGSDGYAVLWGQNGGIHIYTSATDRASTSYAAQFNSSGNLAFASGKGIDFSATSDASGMTSELLDDYEEGTWTPIDNSAGLTLSNNDGRYVKVGSLVHCWARLQYPTTSNTSNNSIGGFPFTNLWTNPVNYSGNITITNYGSADILPMVENNNIVFRNYSNNTFNNSQLSGKFMYFEFDLRT